MRILMLVTHPSIKGPIPKITPHLVSGLRSQGCIVATEPWGRRHDAESLGGKIIGRAQDIARIRRTLHREMFDVMLVNTAHDWATLSRDLPLLLATRGLCRCIVLHLHGSQPGPLLGLGHYAFKEASALLLRLSDAVLVLSSEEQRQWRQFNPLGKFHLVVNPFLPDEDLSSATNELKWIPPNDEPVLLFVGRLMEAKGILDLVDAMPRVLERTVCHLVVVGDGPVEQQLRERIERLGLADHVTLTGYTVGGQLSAIYRIADVFVLPTYWAEGFPTVIAEAMGAGLPIVTTRIRGATDHLKEGTNALFVPPRDPEALADAVERILCDPALCAKMAQANQDKVKDFAPEIVSRQYLSILEETLQAKNLGQLSRDSATRSR